MLIGMIMQNFAKSCLKELKEESQLSQHCNPFKGNNQDQHLIMVATKMEDTLAKYVVGSSILTESQLMKMYAGEGLLRVLYPYIMLQVMSQHKTLKVKHLKRKVPEL